MPQLSSLLRSGVAFGGVAFAVAIAAGSARMADQHPPVTTGSDDATCVGCHQSVQQQAHRRAHGGLRAGCTSCHDVGGKRPALLRADVNEICLACHAAGAPPISPLSRIAVGGVEISAEFGASARVALDARGGGHPIAGHPVSGRPDPLSPGRELTCASCHLSHGGEVQRLLRFAPGSNQGICGPCHAV